MKKKRADEMVIAQLLRRPVEQVWSFFDNSSPSNIIGGWNYWDTLLWIPSQASKDIFESVGLNSWGLIMRSVGLVLNPMPRRYFG